jgi:hypothetical protein
MVTMHQLNPTVPKRASNNLHVALFPNSVRLVLKEIIYLLDRLIFSMKLNSSLIAFSAAVDT